jgi:hypothetical protein
MPPPLQGTLPGTGILAQRYYLRYSSTGTVNRNCLGQEETNESHTDSQES